MITLKIKTQFDEYIIQKNSGVNLKDVLTDLGINFIFPCGGRGSCGNCKVIILKNLEKPNKIDEIKISQNELNNGKRLACCLNLTKDTEIILKETEIQVLD